MAGPIFSATSLAGRDEAALVKGAKKPFLASLATGSLALRHVEDLTWAVSDTPCKEVTHRWQAPRLPLLRHPEIYSQHDMVFA